MLTPHLTSHTPPTLSHHFSTRLRNQPFQNHNTQAPPKSHTKIPNTIQNQSTSQHSTKPQSTKQNPKNRPYPTLHILDPPYTFNLFQFRNPPNTSTFQNTQTKAPPKSHAEIPDTIQNTKHLPTRHQTPKHKGKIRSTALMPHLTPYTPPCTFTPFLNPPQNSTLQTDKTQSTSQNKCNYPKHNP